MNLVTGGTGLIGGHLLYHLIKSGEEVRALYRSEESRDITRQIFSYYENGEDLFGKIKWVKGDILDLASLEAAFEGISDVYHCAAVVSYDTADYDKIMKVNIEGTANMVNTALTTGIRKFCHVSSIASFGRAERNEFVTEDTHWENSITPSLYAISKYHAEMEVWRAIQEGLKAVIVNPSVVLGSGNWENGSSSLFSKVWKGLPYYTKGINGYVDVMDVVNCMMKLMKSDVNNEHFILVSENITFEKLLVEMAEKLGKKRPYIKVNRFLGTLARIMESAWCKISGKKPFITKSTVNVALDKQFYSNEKIRNRTGIEFIPVSSSISRISGDFIKSFS